VHFGNMSNAAPILSERVGGWVVGWSGGWVGGGFRHGCDCGAMLDDPVDVHAPGFDGMLLLGISVRTRELARVLQALAPSRPRIFLVKVCTECTSRLAPT
jgi:hypothetical protein